MRVRPSTPHGQVLVQLRPGDHFIISSRRFSLTVSEPVPAELTPSVSEHSIVVDLEQDNMDDADTDLPLQGEDDVGTSSASDSQTSLPGDEIDLLQSANLVVSNEPDLFLSSSESRLHDADVGFVAPPTAEGCPLRSMESIDRVNQTPALIGKDISPPRIGAEQQQNDLAREEQMQDQSGGGGPSSDEASTRESEEEGPEQDSTPDLERATPAKQQILSPEISILPEGMPCDMDALPIDAISPGLAPTDGDTSPAPSTSEVTHSITLLLPPILKDDRQLGNDADASRLVTRAEPKPTPEAQDGPQTLNEQPPETTQCPSDVEATEHHDTHPVDGCTSHSSPRNTRASSRQAADATLVAGSGVEGITREDSAEASNFLPQAQDADTQNSTTAMADVLLGFAVADSEQHNIAVPSEGELAASTPNKVTRATDIEGEALEDNRSEPDTTLAPAGDDSTNGGAEVDSPPPATAPARGRPRETELSKLKRSLKRKLGSPDNDAGLQVQIPAKRRKTQGTESSMESTIEIRPRASKRKLESPDKDAGLQLKTPAKRRKAQDTESGVGSTIEVRPRASSRKVSSSQTSKREIRGVSAMVMEPNLSTPSQRTRQRQGSGAKKHHAQPPRVLFSSNSTVDEEPHLMAFFAGQGGKQVKTVKECTVLCVGPGELKKTGKLLLAVVSGTDIVRDKWLVDSAEQHRLLDLKSYSAEDPDREVQWGTKLADAIARGKAGTKPFADSTIYFTPALKKELGGGFLELKDVALLAGATAVHARLPPKGAGPQADIVVLASSHDKDAPALAEAGWVCYGKDVISMSVLQGRLNTESFRLDREPATAESSGGRKRKRR